MIDYNTWLNPFFGEFDAGDDGVLRIPKSVLDQAQYDGGVNNVTRKWADPSFENRMQWDDKMRQSYQQLITPDAAGRLRYGTNIAGLAPKQMQTGSFMDTGNNLFTKNGQQFYRVGSGFDEYQTNPQMAEALRKAGIKASDFQYDTENGYYMRPELVSPMSDAIANALGTHKGDSPLEAAGMTVLPMMGLAGIAGALTGAGGLSSLSGFAPEGGYQSLFSSLGQNAASQGGSFADILKNFTPSDAPWGVNPTGFNVPGAQADLDKFMEGLKESTKNAITLRPDGTLAFAGGMGALGALGTLPAGSAGPFDASGVGTGVDAGTMSSTAGLGQGVTGTVFPSISSEAGTAATSALGKILSGSGTMDDYLKIAGIVGSTGLGILGAQNQTDAIRDAQNSSLAALQAAQDKSLGFSKETRDLMLGLGQPYRDRLNASYAPGFDLSASDPAYRGALDQSSQSVLRGLSAGGSGNPYDQPNSMTSALDYVTKNTALPQLNTFRSQLGSFGGLGVNPAGTAGLQSADTALRGGLSSAGILNQPVSDSGVFNALGFGLNQALSPEDDFSKLMKQLSGMKLNLGTGF